MNIFLVLAFSSILSVWADPDHAEHNQAPPPQDHSAHSQVTSPARASTEAASVTTPAPRRQQTQVVVTPDSPAEPRSARQPARVVEGVGQGGVNCDEPCVTCTSHSSCRNTRAADSSRQIKEVPSSGTSSHTGHEGSSTSPQ